MRWEIKLNESVKQEIAEQILAYLREHPDAGDTIEGISEWWLMEQRIKIEVATVKKALHMLEEEALVIKSPAGIYTVNPAKVSLIQDLLNGED